jgi:hypothetical protein
MRLIPWCRPSSVTGGVLLGYVAFLILQAACASSRVQPPRIHSILVPQFECRDSVIAQAVQNVFIETLLRHADVRVVREGPADVQLEGTVVVASGETSRANLGGRGSVFFGGQQGAGGEYVSGVTALALRGGEILTSASWGQSLGKGQMLPPESVARMAGLQLLGALRRQGLKVK